MGEIYKTICSCGYSQNEIYLGIGMSDWYPELVLCKKCEIVTSADLENENESKCKTCDNALFSYSENNLIKKITSNGKDVYKYYCPNCCKFNLELHESGCWD